MSGEIKGTIPCELFGGPLDGAAYGDLPDTGAPLTGWTLSVPLRQPSETSPFAVYVCHGDVPVHGRWQFFYDHTEPGADAAHGEAEAPTGTQLSTRGLTTKES